jgi:rhodanese-related sulfurtransferase
MQSKSDNVPIEIEFNQVNADGNHVIIDCRTAEEYESGHLKHAVNIPLQHLSFVLDTFPCEKDDTFYVYCRSGNRSSTFVTYLRSIGFEYGQSITDGFESWGDSTTC